MPSIRDRPLEVGFVGLGAMGARMARRLVDAGHDVRVWNRTPSKAESLAAAGARVAATPAEAAAGRELVVSMVRDADALVAVTRGGEGVLAALDPGAVLVEMSTVGPAAVRELAALVQPPSALLDAPVLGSVDEAREGRLRIFVGGDEATYARAKPLLDVLGEPLHAGPGGAGAAAKLVANSTLFAVLTALGEAIALGDALGLERAVVFDVLASTPLAAQAERRRPAIERGEYPPRFSLPLARKDAELIADVAAREGVQLPVAHAARTWLADAERRGLPDRDYSSVVGWIVDRARPSTASVAGVEWPPRGPAARYTVRLHTFPDGHVDLPVVTQLGELKAAVMAAGSFRQRDPGTGIWGVEIVRVEWDFVGDPARDVLDYLEVS